MKKINVVKLVGASAALLSLGAMALSSGVVSASTAVDTLSKTSIQSERLTPPKMENVTRTVANIDNGVKITMTSTDADTVTKLQSIKHMEKRDERAGSNMTVTQINIANGIEVSVTSTDADEVTKIQERTADGKGFGFGGGRGGEKGGVFFDESVTRTVTKIDNGIQVTITSTDADVVTKLQASDGKGFGFGGGRGMGRGEMKMQRTSTTSESSAQ